MIKIICFATLALLFTSLANAHECRALFETHSVKRLFYIPQQAEPIDLDLFLSFLSPVDQKLASFLIPGGEVYSDPNTPMLTLRWQQQRPEVLVTESDGTKMIQPASKPYYKVSAPDISVRSDAKEGTIRSLLKKVHGLWGPMAYLPDFYEQVYANYAPRIRAEIIRTVKAVDEMLPEQRVSFGEIFAEQLTTERGIETNKKVGTYRVYDATGNLTPSVNTKHNMLPLMWAFHLRGLLTLRNPQIFKLHQRIENLIQDNPNFKVFELGKLSIDPAVKDQVLRERILNAFDAYIYREYLSKYPDGIILIHVASPENLRLFRRRYGYKPVAEILVANEEGGEPVTETVLEISLKELKGRFETRLGL